MEYIVSAALVLAGSFLHFTVLRGFALRISRDPKIFKRPLLVVSLFLFTAHLFEVLLYALGFYFLQAIKAGSLEMFGGGDVTGFSEFFYFSISSYTTLGIGDIVPHDGARFLSGIEGLHGLVLIAWSASFTYLMMERFWNSDFTDVSS